MAVQLRYKLNLMKLLRKILPFVISIILLVILAGYAPWGQVGHILGDLDFTTVVLLLLLSLAYYGLKSWRFWYLLNAMEIKLPRTLVITSYMSAQPMSLLPAGEIFRSHALERYSGVPITDSLPQFTMQGLLEAIGMCIIAGISAASLQTLRIPFVLLAIFVLLSIYGIRKNRVETVTRWANRLPFVNLTEETIRDLNRRHAVVLSRKNLPFLIVLSVIIEIIGAAIAYVSVDGLGGHINVFQAALFYVIPVLIGFLSFLPGGIGASEHGAVGVLLLSDVTVGLAVAATLVMRTTIVLLGVMYGVIAEIIGRTFVHDRYVDTRRKHATV